MEEPGHEIVGRERELAQVKAFIGSVPQGPSALLLEGAAGIGKTTLVHPQAPWEDPSCRELIALP